MRLLLLLVLFNGVKEVSADQTKTALIAAGCIAGGLLVSAAAIGAILCFIRQKRRAEKRPLPKYQEGITMANGIYRPERFIRRSSTFSGTSQHSDIRDQRRSLRAKTFTQNAQSPRQRPPVLFYTIRADPRLYPEVQMGLPIYSRPPQVGRPVFFLDRSDNSKSKRNAVDFMYPNSGTMLYLASDTVGIITGITNDERARKDKPRSQSFSRSHRPEIFARRHSDTSETSLIGAPGDVILRPKMDTTIIHSKTTNPNRHDDNNNNSNNNNKNHFKTYSGHNATEAAPANFVNHASNIMTYINKNIKYIPGERFSVTQLQTNNIVYPASNKPLGNRHFVYRERGGTIDFGDDDDSLSSTPRKDYPNDTPKTTGIPRLSHIETESRPAIKRFSLTDAEETPREDYGLEIASQIDYSERFIINVKEIEDIIAMSEQSTKYTGEKENDKADNEMTMNRQNVHIKRRSSSPSLGRPASPPFDGGELVVLSVMSVSSPAERPNTGDSGFSQPTPSPYMATSSLDFQVPPPFPPPPPPPPPLPTGNGKHRPPTPRTELADYEDISEIEAAPNTVRKSSTGKELPEIKTPAENQTKLGHLPFMEELKRRQRSIDEGVSLLPPTIASTTNPLQGPLSDNNLRRNSAKDNSSNHSNDLSKSESSKKGLSQRPSAVQFADDPPEIIPPDEDYNVPGYGDAEDQGDTEGNIFLSFSPPLPPPPPPPLPSHF